MKQPTKNPASKCEVHCNLVDCGGFLVNWFNVAWRRLKRKKNGSTSFWDWGKHLWLLPEQVYLIYVQESTGTRMAKKLLFGWHRVNITVFFFKCMWSHIWILTCLDNFQAAREWAEQAHGRFVCPLHSSPPPSLLFKTERSDGLDCVNESREGEGERGDRATLLSKESR